MVWGKSFLTNVSLSGPNLIHRDGANVAIATDDTHVIISGTATAIPTAERQKLLEDAARQTEYGAPRLEELVDQSNQRESEVADGQYQDMPQQL